MKIAIKSLFSLVENSGQNMLQKKIPIFLYLGFILLSLFNCSNEMDNNFLKPGLQPDGTYLMANGWIVSPSGTVFDIDGLAGRQVISPDNRFLVSEVSNNGNTFLSVFDIEKRDEIQRIAVGSPISAMTFSADGTRFFAANAHDYAIMVYDFQDGNLISDSQETVQAKNASLTADLAVSPDNTMLLKSNLLVNNISLTYLDIRNSETTIEVGSYPSAVKIHPDGKRAFVAHLGENAIRVIDLSQAKEIRKIDTAYFPANIELSSDGSTLYAVHYYDDLVSKIKTDSYDTETISVSPYPNAPHGSGPMALAVSDDGKTLYVANSGNNSISVIDVAGVPAKIAGSIPAGLFPTNIYLTENDAQLIVTSRYGNRQRTLFSAMSLIPAPDKNQLAVMTERVNRNNGFDSMEEKIGFGKSVMVPRALPQKIGEPSLIKHVFLIVDGTKRGNGLLDNTTVNKDLVPNLHTLSANYSTLSNLYGDERSAISQIITGMDNYESKRFDFSEKIPAISIVPALWDRASEADISVKVYGNKGNDTFKIYSENNASEKISFVFFESTSNSKMTDEAQFFINALNKQADGNPIEQLHIFHLSTQEAGGISAMRDIDTAIGMLVEAISKSPAWKESAIFIIPASGSSGTDDFLQKSTAVIASPYVRKGLIDGGLYTNFSILKTIELILGLQPLSQFDAYAPALFPVFTDSPDFKPYSAIQK